MIKPELVIFDTDAESVDALRRDFRLPFVTVIQGNGKQATAAAHLNALFLTWMQAEQLGITPSLERHTAAVVLTPRATQEKGFPPYIVAGVNFASEDSRDPVIKLKITVEALWEAISAFNSANADAIERVGTIPDNLLLDRLPPATVAAVLEAAWRRPGPRAD